MLDMPKSKMTLLRLPPGVPTYSSRHGVFQWPPGQAPTPLLADDYDLFWVMRGSATLELGDGRTLRAEKDEFMILPAFVAGTIAQAQAPLTFTFFHFGFRAGSPRRRRYPDALGSAGRKVYVPMTFTRREAPSVWRIIRAINALKRTRPDYDWRLEQMTVELITELALFGDRRGRRAGDELFHAGGPPDARVAAVSQRIQDEPGRAWRVTELAESVELSPSRLHALCRQTLGRSLKSHIIQTRLRHALMLLRERKEEGIPSIKEVSTVCGFSSQHFFSRQFKAMFGVPPTELRDSATL
jgi:AraC-like DNA-binding protein